MNDRFAQCDIRDFFCILHVFRVIAGLCNRSMHVLEAIEEKQERLFVVLIMIR